MYPNPGLFFGTQLSARITVRKDVNICRDWNRFFGRVCPSGLSWRIWMILSIIDSGVRLDTYIFNY